MRVIAVFGGAFNPPLNSHFGFAEEIVNQYENIEKIIFVPVSGRYDKQGLISDEHRYNMLKLVCSKNPKFLVSRIEIDDDIHPYTVDTLETIKTEYPENEIWFITGTDNLKQLPRWHGAELLLTEFKILVLQRDDDNIDKIIADNKLLNSHRESFVKLETNNDLQYYKSSYVRKLIGQGKPFKQYMPEEVYEYIEENNLYKM